MKLRVSENKFISVVIVSVLTFLTLSTSVMAVSKILGSFEHGAVKSESGDLSKEKAGKVTGKKEDLKGGVKNEGAKGTSTQKISTKKTVGTSLKISAKPANIIARSNSPTLALNNRNSNSSNCIVTIFGKQYDVTSLVGSHSGGNVFNCGTDMSATYQSRHGTNVSLIAPYLVASSAITSSMQNGQATDAPTSKKKHEEEEEDEGGD